LGNTIGVPLIILSRQDENLAAINTILREAGHPVHGIRIEKLNELEEMLQGSKPDMIIYFDDERLFELISLVALLKKFHPAPPLVLAKSQVNEQNIAEAMECGARDVVSLTHKNRLQAVLNRELQTHRLGAALDAVLSSANQHKQELRTLMEGTAEAIADVQEGIIVAANSAWLSIYGYEREEDVIGLPFMDLHRESDRPGLKGALVACLKNKWDGSALELMALQSDGSSLPLEINLEKVTVDGDPAVRIIVPGEGEHDPEKLVEQAVYRDPSTNFYHRYFLLEKLDERLRKPLQRGVRAMAYIRPDRFASVHDDIGLLATETLLIKLAGLLKEFMQPTDLYGRFGGTMFVVLLERGTMLDVQTWAEQIRKAVEGQLFEVDEQSTSITCSIGLTDVDTETSTPASLLTEVEKACRKGRDSGGNRVQITERSRASQALQEQDAAWTQKIRDALMKNRMRLVHQPITSLTKEMEGVFDTSLRMLDENDEIILPSEFLPAAERANMVKNIDRWVIGESFSFCAAKQPQLVFIRLSRESIIDPTVLDWLRTRLHSTGIEASRVCFQVAEEAAAQNLKHTKSLAEALREIGFLFAVDHLGTGRDPKQIFNHIPMDFVKIDGSLMQGLRRDPKVQQTIAELARMAKDQDIKTIAERVEDANTMATLWQLGISYIQGNYNQMHGVVLEDTQTVRGLESTTTYPSPELSLE
jgi:diguanylate cyclase (GGDEF)-like protein/PAS domain S-box-containing protein